MGSKGRGKGKKGLKRVAFRSNRQRPARRKGWTGLDDADPELLSPTTESVRAKGDLSRKRTVSESPGKSANAGLPQREGVVTLVSGQFVEVDDGNERWLCTVRRVLRTQAIGDRKPVVVGDRVLFLPEADGTNRKGVIEHFFPRRSSLTRCDAKRTHTLAANVDQVVIVSSILEPMIKPHLIDRYLVSAHAGGLAAIVCVNKADLDPESFVQEYLERFKQIGYPTLATSTVTGEGVEELRQLMAGKVTLLAGQSGVGKSSLLNAVQPSLALKTAAVSQATEKGRHTTTSAVWLKLDGGGAVVDTPGIRALEVAMVPLHELEMHFVEFVDLVPLCKFPDCVHIHEEGCAIRAAVEDGRIDGDRYASYLELFMELSQVRASQYD